MLTLLIFDINIVLRDLEHFYISYNIILAITMMLLYNFVWWVGSITLLKYLNKTLSHHKMRDKSHETSKDSKISKI